MDDDILDNVTDYSEECDYNALKNKIKKVLKRYFECDDSGDPNKEHDPDYTAQDAIDDIHEIIGEI